MSESADPEERRGGDRGWRDVLSHYGDEAVEARHEELINFVITSIPEGYQEVPDFRLPPGLLARWRRDPTLRAKLHAWRLEFDEDYRDWQRKRQMRRGTKSGGWGYAEQQAEALYDDLMGHSQPASRLVKVQGIIARLQDKAMAPDKKSKAVEELTDFMSAWEEEKAAIGNEAQRDKDEEYDAARSMRTLDLIRAIKHEPES